MSSLPTRAPAAAVPDRPTPEGERALRQALGSIAGANAPGTRHVYAADWRHYRRLHLDRGPGQHLSPPR